MRKSHSNTVARRLTGLGVVVLLVALATAGCPPPDDGDVPTIPEPDGTDVQPDTADTGTDIADTSPDTSDTAGSDTSDADGGDGGSDGPDIPETCTEASPTPASERTEVGVGEWSIATPSDSDTQNLLSDIRAGEFEIPSGFGYGTVWSEASSNDDGSVPAKGVSGARTTAFAATTVSVANPKTVVAYVDDMFRIFANGSTQPGGIYGHGDKKVPLELERGDNTIVVQFLGRQNPTLRLHETPDKLAFNNDDTTVPELRVGHSTEQPLGIAVLNTAGRTLKDVEAQVLENDHFQATTTEYPFLGPNATTQVSFQLKPKSDWSSAGESIPVELAISSCGTSDAYKTTVELDTVAADEAFKRTFRSPVDGSTQYYAVLPPKNYQMGKKYGVALALHGAGVDAKGHVTAYSKKDWLYHVAPTNRRRYGFNWEEWGKFNGMNALDHAMDSFTTDPTRVYVTGHSMGGHGTWHLGVMHPGRFATVGPSAGWESIYTYPNDQQKPSGSFRRARAHSETTRYLSNLSDRGGYIIHGGADNNVPTEQGRTMRDELKKHTNDVTYHEEPGAGHWWDGDNADGTDCVDWSPLFTFFDNHTLDPNELDFKFESPGPWYSDEHSYVKIRSSETPLQDVALESTKQSSTEVELTTTNVRSMELDGQALTDKGIQTIVVDGTSKSVKAQTMYVGPKSGKKPGKNGTFNQVLREPFCFVFPTGEPAYRRFASYLLSNWSIRGNGHACALPATQLDDEIRQARNLVYLGVDFDQIPDSQNRPFSWTDQQISIGPNTYNQGLEQVVFPTDDGMGAAIAAVDGDESLLYSLSPFSSRRGMPDYILLARGNQGIGALAAGFFDNDWKYDSSLGSAR